MRAAGRFLLSDVAAIRPVHCREFGRAGAPDVTLQAAAPLTDGDRVASAGMCLGPPIWVPLTWPCRILEFISTPKQWACLWPCGGIETFALDDRRRRVVFMRPEEAYAVHQKHPLVDISLNEQTLTLRFRRPSETRGTINAEPALRRACHLPVTGRHKDQAA